MHAQNADFIFKHITVNDGLLSNTITALCQDSEGFMWVGTQIGLQRYDGTRFKNFQADIRDTTALQTDWISSIFEDSKKRLWIGTDHGSPYVLNRTTCKFYNYNLHASPGNKINGTWHFAEDKKGNIFLAGHEGFFKLESSTNQFVKWNSIIGLEKNMRTGAMTIDSNDNLWLSVNESICCYNVAEKKLYSSLYNPAHNPIFDIKKQIGNILFTSDQIWISTGERSIYRYDIRSKKISAFTFDMLPSKKLGPEFQKEITGSVYQLKNNQIVVPLMERGLAYYHHETESFTIIDADNSSSYRYHTVNSNEKLLQDKGDNIIIGNGTGLNIYNPEKQLFFSHGSYNDKGKDFPRSMVNDFLELPDGNILIGYYSLNGGIVKTNNRLEFLKHYLFNENGNKNSLVNVIWNLFRDETGIIWAPNQKKSVVKLDPITDNIREDKDSSLKGSINIIKQGDEGDIWIGHWTKGLGRINQQKHHQNYFTSFIHSDNSTPKRVHSILVDADKIWAGTFQNGLQVFDKNTEKFTAAYLVNERNKNTISSNTILDILRYNADTLLLATEMGVNIFDTKRKLFKAITAKQGLPNNLVLGLLLDSASNLWVVCSGGGFCKINMHTLAVTSYDINDGIIDNEFSGKIFSLKNGNALIGASKSFISFKPSGFAASAPPANVVITGVSVFDKEVMVDSLLKNNQPLILSYKENSLKMEFASLEFWAPATIKYFYKLDGVDADWIDAGKNNVAIYNQLNSGNYIFEVKCANRDGIYCKEITTLHIQIAPPFWQTWWFLILVLATIVLLIFLFVRGREKSIRAIEAEKLKVQRLNAERYKSKMEMEQIINYFSSSLIDKNTVNEVIWDVTKNLIGRLDFEDCMIYLWNSDKTKMVQKAGHGPKGSVEDITKSTFDVSFGQGMIGFVMQTKEPVLIDDTSKDSRYRVDDIARLSELTVPVIYNDELIGVIDSEHHKKEFFTQQHLQVLTTIATLMANKIKSIESEQSLRKSKIEMLQMNEKLSEAKLETLRSQMNPHFIFNSLNAIQECILTGKVDAAYKYLLQFSRLQRMVLNNSAKEFILLSNELEMLKLYLSLESLRFGQSFNYTIEVDNDTDMEEIMVPSMIIQPFVENAIWHGLRNKEGEKNLTILCKETGGDLIITIQDNGIGRKRAALIKSQKTGVDQEESKGTILSIQRLNILSLKYKSQIYLEIIDLLNDHGVASGTKVIIKLPADIEASKI